jgi:hypothetical protein
MGYLDSSNEPLTTHVLARKLLELPDAPLVLNVFGHHYDPSHSQSGPLRLVRRETGYRFAETPIVITGSAVDTPGDVLWEDERRWAHKP